MARRYGYPHTGNSWCRSWRFNGSVFWSVGFSIQGEATGVARSAPQGAHYHADVMAFRVWLPTNIFYAPLDNAPLHSIQIV